jgi:hypothetical protein
MVNIDAFVEVSASKARSLQPKCPHGTSTGKNYPQKILVFCFYKKILTDISNGKLTINGKVSLIAKLSK